MPLSVLAPSLCWACGAASAGRALCHACRGRLRWAERTAEPVCGVPAWSPVVYDGPARALVGALKFRGARGLAGELAAAIAAGAPEGLLEGALVPVPLARSRLRRRGYNQAAELARELSQRTGCPYTGRSSAEAARLARPAAAAAPGWPRRPAFAPVRLAPPRAVLVDDVITTGATLAACAQSLRAAGAREVVAVSYARTPGR